MSLTVYEIVWTADPSRVQLDFDADELIPEGNGTYEIKNGGVSAGKVHVNGGQTLRQKGGATVEAL